MVALNRMPEARGTCQHCDVRYRRPAADPTPADRCQRCHEEITAMIRRGDDPTAGASTTACDDQWCEDRADAIGQNGAPAEHYPEAAALAQELGIGNYYVRSFPKEALGRKFDGEKPRFDLLLEGMPLALTEVVRVLTYGSRKYEDHNWQFVDRAPQRYLAAGMRHEMALATGESRDPETGAHHLAHKLCCDLFRLELALREVTA